MKITHFLSSLSLAALLLPATAQEQEQAPAAAPETATISEEPNAPDSVTGFAPEAIQEWQAIETDLRALENQPEALIELLNANLEKELHADTKRLLRAVKAAVLNEMLNQIYLTAQTEADVMKAKDIALQMVAMMDNEDDKKAAIEEIEQRFSDPAALLQQVLDARAEQEAATEAELDDEEAEAAPALTEADYARIAEIRKELEPMTSTDQKLEYLKGLCEKENAGVQNWIQPHMVQILLEEMQQIQAAGFHTVEDVLKTKTLFTKLINYCYPEAEKAQALEILEQEYADPEALLKRIQESEQEELDTEEPTEDTEEGDEEDYESYEDEEDEPVIEIS